VDNSSTTNVLVELKEKIPLKISMDSQELRDRYYGGEGQSRDAFEELCALYDAIQVRTKCFIFFCFLKDQGLIFLSKHGQVCGNIF
jgi:hypothetical protein